MSAEAAVQTPQTVPDFTQLAEQLSKLSEFFQSIEKKTKVYADNTEGTKATKLVESANIVRSRQQKRLEKAQYQDRLQDAKDTFQIEKQIARQEYQIARKLKGNVTFEKIHYMKDAFKQSRTHRNLISAAFSAFITGFSLGHKQTQINRYKKQIALLAAKEEYREAQKRTLDKYVQKQKELREAHKTALKKPKPQKALTEKHMQKVLKNIDSQPFDIHEALDIWLIPRYGTAEYKSLPQERKDALKIATKRCMNPDTRNSKAITFKDFREMVDRYEEMLLVTGHSRTPVRTSPQKPRPAVQKTRAAQSQQRETPQKNRTMTR